MSDCPICSTNPDDVWIFGEHALALPHSQPFAPGHCLVASRRHVSVFYDLDVQEQQAVWNLVGAVKSRILEALNVDRFHIGFSDFHDGSGHAHLHVVPCAFGEDVQLPAGIEWVQD